jgi:hypothetical protein
MSEYPEFDRLRWRTLAFLKLFVSWRLRKVPPNSLAIPRHDRFKAKIQQINP